MTNRPIRNMAASVHQRLLTAAKSSGRPFGDLLQLYGLERWLYRLSKSKYHDRFILKGALLLLASDLPTTRPTRDIDLLGRISNDLDNIRGVMIEVIDTGVPDDGLSFDSTTVSTERIAEDADYAGVRVKFPGKLGNVRIPMQIDIGFSDVITPQEVDISYPTLLGDPPVVLSGYTLESVIAEKFEAMVKLGELNSRMKDFYDVWLLSTTQSFEGPKLAAAIRATFDRRGTAINPEPACFSPSFINSTRRQVQWRAFTRRATLDGLPDFQATVIGINAFLQSVSESLSSDSAFTATWSPNDGTWK